MIHRSLKQNRFCLLLALAGGVWWLAPSNPAEAASPSVADALGFKPMQDGVDYERPSEGEVADCQIKAEKIGGNSAWVVRAPSGNVLRQFSDSNSDHQVDTWSYYQNGVEVYRDLDSNFNGKADQFRWFQTGGSRWGVDKNEDGKIDYWQLLSPEEAAEEAVEAARAGDKSRFARLLLTQSDMKKLNLPEELVDRISKRLGEASSDFDAMVKSRKLSKQAEFSDFGGLRPGMVPAGTLGLKDDVLVYENVWAMVHDGDSHEQMQLGTMIRVGNVWKLIDGPKSGQSDQATVGLFYDSSGMSLAATAPEGAPSEEMQELLAAIEKLDVQIVQADEAQKPKLNDLRADLLERLAKSAPNPRERDQWLRQLADMVSAAVQEGGYPQGAKRLATIEQQLAKAKASDSLLTHFKFRRMQAEYGLKLSSPKADYAKVQGEWLEQLKEFVGEHKTSEHASEALLQLAMASEFAGDSEEAEKWYRQIVANFPKSQAAEKAAGAATRLTSEGRAISLSGEALAGGKPLDLRSYRGKPVVIQYWISSYKACKAEHAVLKDLYSKYGGKGFEVVGVNLDYTRTEVMDYLKSNPLPWQQIYEPGGFDSRLANEMGVIILPLMILVDQDGKVVTRNVQAAELETELKKLM